MKHLTCVISQPTYIPWLGYFDLIDQADIFVLLDTVQFDKRSWQQRNRIKTRNGLEWLSIPVLSKGRFHQEISKTEVADQRFSEKHICTVRHNYRRSSCFETFFPLFRQYLGDAASKRFLSDINSYLIRSLCEYLDIKTPILRSSEMTLPGRRSSLLVNICKEVGATEYLSTPGSYSYLMEDRPLFLEHGINISIHSYHHPIYKQTGNLFEPYASIIDLIFNEGESAKKIIRTGRQPNIPIIKYEP